MWWDGIKFQSMFCCLFSSLRVATKGWAGGVVSSGFLVIPWSCTSPLEWMSNRSLTNSSKAHSLVLMLRHSTIFPTILSYLTILSISTNGLTTIGIKWIFKSASCSMPYVCCFGPQAYNKKIKNLKICIPENWSLINRLNQHVNVLIMRQPTPNGQIYTHRLLFKFIAFE